MTLTVTTGELQYVWQGRSPSGDIADSTGSKNSSICGSCCFSGSGIGHRKDQQPLLANQYGDRATLLGRALVVGGEKI